MPQTPHVTVVDPQRDGPGDLLTSGDDTGRAGWSRRTRVLAGVLTVAGLAALVVVPRVQAAREQQRERDAAFAVADTVHLRLGAPIFSSTEDGRLQAGLHLEDDGTRGYRDRLTRLVLEGGGLSAVDANASGLNSVGVDTSLSYLTVPADLWAQAKVDCAAVASGRYPATVTLVATIVPASGVAHVQRMPMDPAKIREQSLTACLLPDPDARPIVGVEGWRGSLLLYLEAVHLEPDELLLEALSLPGFEILPRPGRTLPYSLEANSGAFFYDFGLGVVDCALAARDSGAVRVRLRTGDVVETRSADDTTPQPQPGGVRFSVLRQQLLDAHC